MNLIELKNYYYDNTRNMSNSGKHDDEKELKIIINAMFDDIKQNNTDDKKNELINKIDDCILVVNRNNMYNYLIYLYEKIDYADKYYSKLSKSDIVIDEYAIETKNEIRNRIDKSYNIVSSNYNVNSYKKDLKNLNSNELDIICELLQDYMGYLISKKYKYAKN